MEVYVVVSPTSEVEKDVYNKFDLFEVDKTQTLFTKPRKLIKGKEYDVSYFDDSYSIYKPTLRKLIFLNEGSDMMLFTNKKNGNNVEINLFNLESISELSGETDEVYVVVSVIPSVDKKEYANEVEIGEKQNIYTKPRQLVVGQKYFVKHKNAKSVLIDHHVTFIQEYDTHFLFMDGENPLNIDVFKLVSISEIKENTLDDVDGGKKSKSYRKRNYKRRKSMRR
jgi:hypothetical protein